VLPADRVQPEEVDDLLDQLTVSDLLPLTPPCRTWTLTSLNAWTPPNRRLTSETSSCSAPRSRLLPLRLWRYARSRFSSRGLDQL
jgi:hypothetical protein